MAVESPLCPKCGGGTKLKTGGSGQFYGCLRYPECLGTVDAASITGSETGETRQDGIDTRLETLLCSLVDEVSQLREAVSDAPERILRASQALRDQPEELRPFPVHIRVPVAEVMARLAGTIDDGLERAKFINETMKALGVQSEHSTNILRRRYRATLQPVADAAEVGGDGSSAEQVPTKPVLVPDHREQERVEAETGDDVPPGEVGVS